MKFIFAAVVLALSVPSMASVKCQPDYIKGVQIKANGEVVYTTASGVRRGVGKFQNNPGVQFMVQTLFLAVEKRLHVQVAYPDGFNCDAENTQAAAEWVYIQNAGG